MNDLLLDEIPIIDTGLVVNLTIVPQSLDDLGITPGPNAKFVRFYYDPAAVEVVARYSHDPNFSLTDLAGIPVVPLDITFFNVHMFLGAQLRTLTGTLAVYTEQFDVDL